MRTLVQRYLYLRLEGFTIAEAVENIAKSDDSEHLKQALNQIFYCVNRSFADWIPFFQKVPEEAIVTIVYGALEPPEYSRVIEAIRVARSKV